MSHAASAFSNAYAKTLTEGIRYQEKREQERAELEIRKKLADASFAYHEAQTADLRAKLKQRAATLTKMGRMVPTQDPDQEFLTPGPSVPAGLSGQDIQEHMVGTGESLAPLLKEGGGDYVFNDAGTGNKRSGTFTPHPKDPLNARLDSQFLGGAAASTGAPPSGDAATGGAPSAPSGMEQRGATTAESPPVVQQYGPPKFHRDAKGKWSMTVEAGDIKVTERQEWLDGKSVTVRTLTRPDGSIAEEKVVGQGIPPEAEQALSRSAEEYGPVGSPAHAKALTLLRKAREIPDPMTRQAFIGAIPGMVREAVPGVTGGAGATRPAGGGRSGAAPSGAGPAGAGPVTDVASAQRASEAQKVQQAGAERAATTRADTENRPLYEGAQKRVQEVQAFQRTMQRIGLDFEEGFVGKGFQEYRKAYDAAEKAAPYDSKKYTAGALAGSLREFFGTASDKEIRFRQGVLDASDQLLRARSGAAITEQEYQRLRGALFSLWDEPSNFKVRHTTALSETYNVIADIYKSARTSLQEGSREAERARVAPAPVPARAPQQGTRDSSGRPTIPGGGPRFTPDQVQKVVPVP